MPTVLDAFVVELGLDSRKFQEGERDAMSSFKKTQEASATLGKGLEQSFGKLSDIFTTLKGGAVGVLAAFGGGAVGNFVDNVARMDNAAGMLSMTLGENNVELARWLNMMNMIGGQEGSVKSAFSGLVAAITDFQQGGAMFGPGPGLVFNQIGGVIGKSPSQIMTELSKYFGGEISAGRETPVGAAGYLRRIPGMNDDMINLILKGPEKLAELYAKSKTTVTPETLNNAQEYIERLGELNQAWTNLSRTVVPVLTGIVNILNKITASATEKGGFLNRIFTASPKGFTEPTTDYGGVVNVKPGAGRSSPETEAALKVLAGVAGIKQVTALNDPYHALLGKSLHSQGRAIDLTVTDPAKAQAVADAIKKKLEDAGINANVVNEYDPEKRSKGFTAPHIHVGVPPRKMSSVGNVGGVRGSAVRGGDTNTTTTQIDKVTINTQATDANGIARDFVDAVNNYAGVMSANSAQV